MGMQSDDKTQNVSVPPSELGRWCRSEIAAQGILLAGENLKGIGAVREEHWEAWEKGFKSVVESTAEDAAWNLHADSRRALAELQRLRGD